MLNELVEISIHWGFSGFITEYGLSEYDAETLTGSRELADYYEQAVAILPSQPKLIANWVNGELAAGLNRDNTSITESPVTASMLGELVVRIDDNTISGKIAKEVFEAIWNGDGNVDEIIEKRGLKQISDDSAIEPIIDEILANNTNQVEQYKGGNTKLLGFFVGQVMKATQGKANPKQVNQLLSKKLGNWSEENHYIQKKSQRNGQIHNLWDSHKRQQVGGT